MSRHAQTDPLVFSFMFNRYLLIHLLCSSVYFFHLTLCLQRGWWSAIIYSLISLWISSLLPKTTHKWGLSNKSIFTSLLSSLHVFYFKKKKKNTFILWGFLRKPTELWSLPEFTESFMTESEWEEKEEKIIRKVRKSE